MNLKELLKSAEEGSHPACEDCPWNPKRTQGVAFGKSCVIHGIDWTTSYKTASMLIAQDPGGTTPATTGKLCGVENAMNPTDRSAQNGLELWKAAVFLDESGPTATKYFKNHYWTNAIMHGFKAKNKDNLKEKWIESQREKARVCCAQILLKQINFLSPQIIIATGKPASESLYEKKLITRKWDDFKVEFPYKVYSEQRTLPSGMKTTVYCTFHCSGNGIKFHAAKLYTIETENLLLQKIEKLPDSTSARKFMRLHQNVTEEDKGMRVLLLHYLEIGEGIRRANAEA